MNIFAITRIREEYRDNTQNPVSNIGFNCDISDESDIFKWKVNIFGPSDTPYKGGLFYITLKFSENYPFIPPKVTFDTPIYHINVKSRSDNNDDIGTPDLTILKFWKPEYKVKDILVSIFSLFYMYKIESPCSLDMANELRNNKVLFKEKVKFFTNKYANPMNNHGIKTNWDFTYQH